MQKVLSSISQITNLVTKNTMKLAVYHILTYIFFLFIFFFIFPISTQVFAATATWTDNGGDGNWGTCSNWSGGTGTNGCPGSSDTATFGSASTANVSINSTVNVAGINITSAYTGTISQGSSTVTIGSSNYSQAGGTYTGGTGTITINGSYTLSGGTFTSSSDTTNGLSFTGNFTISGSATFNNNAGIVIFDGSTQTLSCNNIVFNKVVINQGYGGGIINVGSNCNLPLGANPTVTINRSSVTLNGTLSGSGTLTLSTSYGDYNGTLTINSTGSLSGFSGITIGSGTPGLTIAGATADFSSYSPFSIGSFTLSSGTFTGPSSMTVYGGFSITGGIFNAPTTLTFMYANTISCNNVSFNTVVISMGNNASNGLVPLTIESNCNLPLGNNPTVIINRYGLILNGTLSGTGTITFGSNLSDYDGTITFNSGGGLSGFNGVAVTNYPPTFTFAGATADFSSYSPFSIGTLNITSGTLTAPSSMTINGGFSITGGTFNPPATLTFTYADTLSCNNVSFNTVVINLGDNQSSNKGPMIVEGNCNLPLGNNPTVTINRYGLTLNGTLSGSGALTVDNNNTDNTGSLTFNSSGILSGFSGLTITGGPPFIIGGNVTVPSLTIASNSSVSNPASAYTLSITGALINSAGTTFGGTNLTTNFTGSFATLGGNITSSGPCSVTAGTLSLNGNNLSCTNLTVASNGTLQLQGGESVTTPTLNSGSTVKFTGTSGTNSYTIPSWSYSDLTIDTGGMGTNTFNAPSSLSLATFTLANGTFVAPSGSLVLTGNFVHNGGTFTNNSGTVSLTGTSQQISGSTTFHNLSKTVSNTDTLAFGAGDTQTVSGLLTLQGASGNLLSLRSTITGTQWKIDPIGTIVLSHLNIKDSDNIGSVINPNNYTDLVNSGNNTNWQFDTASPTISINSVSSYTTNTTPTITGTATDGDDTVASVQFQMDNISGSWTTCLATDSDGKFDQASVTFSCTPSSTLSDGSHTMYIRATDSNGNTTPSNDYSSASFTVDTTAPSGISLDSPGDGTYTNNSRPTYRWKVTSDATSGLSKYKLEVDLPDGNNFVVDNIPTSGTSDITSNPEYTVHFDGFMTNDPTQEYISVTTNDSNNWPTGSNDGQLEAGSNTWKIIAYDNAGNTTTASRTIYYDTTAPTITGFTSGNVGTDGSYQLVTDPTTPLTGIVSDNLMPDKITFAIYKQQLLLGLVTSQSLFTNETYTLPNPHNDTSLTFFYSPQQKLTPGFYEIDATAKDKAGNISTKSTLYLEYQLSGFGTFNMQTGTLPQAALTTTGNEAKQATSITPTPISISQPLSIPHLEQSGQTIRQQQANFFSGLISDITMFTLNASYSISSATTTLANTAKTFTRHTTIVFLKPITYEIGATEQSVTTHIKQNQQRTASTLVKTETAMALTITAIQQPVSHTGNFLDRVKIGAATFYEIVFDPIPTTITNVSIAKINKTNATITWTTNQYAIGKINYGETLSYGRSVNLTAYTKVHTAKLTHLSPGKKYYFEVMAQGKNYVYDSYYTFQTKP